MVGLAEEEVMELSPKLFEEAILSKSFCDEIIIADTSYKKINKKKKKVTSIMIFK